MIWGQGPVVGQCRVCISSFRPPLQPKVPLGWAILLDNIRGVSYHHYFGGANLFGGDLVSIGFILFVAFLLFGPKKLPDIARALGKGMGELRRASNELRISFEEEIRNMDRPSEGASDSAPYYGHNHPEPTREEPESRS
ncbi:MAG: twin-arginine translocase TatA/TatE family subunit [Acidobacteria bacterium]|nr:twin-arginine translocase TatA/TatE family subunit [Acidobacteriota bacterium]